MRIISLCSQSPSPYPVPVLLDMFTESNRQFTFLFSTWKYFERYCFTWKLRFPEDLELLFTVLVAIIHSSLGIDNIQLNFHIVLFGDGCREKFLLKKEWPQIYFFFNMEASAVFSLKKHEQLLKCMLHYFTFFVSHTPHFPTFSLFPMKHRSLQMERLILGFNFVLVFLLFTTAVFWGVKCQLSYTEIYLIRYSHNRGPIRKRDKALNLVSVNLNLSFCHYCVG